jgi:hypothetical protein
MKILNNVIKTAADIYGVDPLDNCRKRPVVYARNAICAVSRECYGMNLKSIGKIINRDHSNVIYSLKQHDILMQYDKEYKAQYETFYSLTHNLPLDKVKAKLLKKLRQLNKDQLAEVLNYVNNLKE